jgi:polyhydroxyalkanoate synthesis regulator phasin
VRERVQGEGQVFGEERVMTEEQSGSGRGRARRDVGDEVREGIRAGIGILSALKDAIEETVDDMMERGELSQDRAREAVRTTMERAQSAFDEARVRFEFVPRREFEELAEDVRELRRRVVRLEADSHGHGGGEGPGQDGPGGPAGDIPVSEG